MKASNNRWALARLSRRAFLNRSTLHAGLGIAVAGGLAPAVGRGKAGSSLRVAVMGVNSRGHQLTSMFARIPGVEIGYICEPDLSVVAQAVKNATDSGQKAPRVVQDFRFALDDPSINVLVCAAPDHWHALAAILACQAGKDVYLEKPASHKIREGRRIVDTARKYGRVIQVGSQRRSGQDFMAAVEVVRSGRLGKVVLAKAWGNKLRPNIGKQAVSTPPSDLDFDLWCGPAPNNGYRKNLVHYHWHWRWDYGCGECGNLGAHSLDIARWALDVEYPERVISGGGRYAHDDDKATPDTQFATFEFSDRAIQWEHRMWADQAGEGERRTWGVTFYGTDATLDCYPSGWRLYQGDELIEEHDRFNCQSAHVENFLECVGTRKKPNADIEIGHRTAVMTHLANIAYRTGETIHFDAATEAIVNNPRASAMMDSNYREGFELP